MDKRPERIGKIIGFVVGVPLCLWYFGIQFLIVALLIGAVIVWEPVSEWWHRRRWERRA